MKAAVLRSFNNVQVEELIVPDLEVGQVLVKVQAATICGAQINEITGAKGPDRFLPHLLGHEGCGVVSAIGPGVTCVRPGQRVVMHWRKGNGIEARAPKYNKLGQVGIVEQIGAGPVATFAEQAIVSENRLTVMPEQCVMRPDLASLLGCAVTTALGLINNEANLKIGQSIVIAGIGGVGINIVQGAGMVSAYPIIAIDVDAHKLQRARFMGATHTFEAPSDALVKTVKAICPKGVDVFVDCTGAPAMINQGFEMVGAGGKLILVGQPPEGKGLFFINGRQHYVGKTILDSQGGLTDPNVDIPRYIKLFEQSRLELEGLITHRFKLDKINDAIALMQTGTAGRIALEMNCD